MGGGGGQTYFHSRPHPQYGWDFPEEIREKLRKDFGTALRLFFLEFLSRVRLPYNSKAFEVSGPQKGPAERGHVKKRQKSSKSVKKIFAIFRAGQKTSKIVKKCQKYFRHFLTIFARHQFSGPFWGPLMKPPEHESRILSPPPRWGRNFLFRSGPGEGFSELIMESPAVHDPPIPPAMDRRANWLPFQFSESGDTS